MENGSSDDLARSQLALLYKLGLIQQDAGEVENDPHAFLNRLPPASSREVYLNERNEPRTSSFQSSGDHSSDGSKNSDGLSPFARVEPFPPPASMDMSRPPPRFEVSATRPTPTDRTTQMPFSVRSNASTSRHNGIKLPIKLRGATNEYTQKIKRQWFAVWKRHVEAKWTLTKATSIGSQNLRKRIFQRWQSVVYKAQLDDARCRQLGHWKAQRALKSWRSWATLHGRVTWFLSVRGRRYALVNRFRRQQTWMQWQQFVLQSRKHTTKTDMAIQWHRHRRLRRFWLEWRVAAFRARQIRRSYRAFLAAVRDELQKRRARTSLAMQQFESHAQARLARLLRRWRVFNFQRQRDHQLTWRIRMEITRAKFFTTWHTAMRHTRQIDKLRQRVRQRVCRDHLRAWCVAVQAITLGRTSTLWHHEAICARYLDAWKRWTRDKLRFHHATAKIQSKQKQRAVGVMRTWTIAHARMSQLRRAADAITRRRILIHVWEGGLLAFHFKRQTERRQISQVEAMAATRALQRWRFEWVVRHAWRLKKQMAVKMAFKVAVHSPWRGWQRLVWARRHHKRQLWEAAQYHYHRLVLSGLVALSRAVDRKCEWTKAHHLVRVNHRAAWKRRVFVAWRHHSQKTRSLDAKLSQFISRPAYAVSAWNPLRRRWRQWLAHTQLTIRVGLLIHDSQRSRRYHVFQAWQRRARVVLKQRKHVQSRERHQMSKTIVLWKQRIADAQAKRDQRGVVLTFYCRKRTGKTLFAWKSLVCHHLRRLRCSAQQVRILHRQFQHRVWFSVWRTKFLQTLGVHALKDRRRRAWLLLCWDAWQQLRCNAKKVKKKLKYYRRIFGAYPATSLLSRLFCRWSQWTRRHVSVERMRLEIDLRQARVCWDAWRTLHLAKLALRRWQTHSVVTSATYNELGKRCRVFREKRQRRLAWLVVQAWKVHLQGRHRQQDKLVNARRCILKEIRAAQAQRHKQRRCCVRLWFQRWRRRQLAALHVAVGVYRARLLRRLLLAWWRQVVHSKQERLLDEARRTMGSLSIHKTSKSAAAQRGRATTTAKTSGRIKTPAPSRGMVDPVPMRRTYLSPSQQLPRKQTLTQPTNRARRDRVVYSEQLPSHRRHERTEHVDHTPAKDIQMKTHTLHCRAERRQSEHVEELPLFDSEEDNVDTRPAITIHQPARLRLQPAPSPLDGESSLTLESLMSMDPYSPVRRPGKELTGIQQPVYSSSSSRTRAQVDSPRTSQHASLYTPSDSLVPHSIPKPRAPNSRAQKHTRASVAKCDEDLVQLLELPTQQDSQAISTFRSVLHDIAAHDESRELTELNITAVVDAIVGYYVTKSHHVESHQPDLRPPQVWLHTWGYCLLRDLGLFENGHYLSAMERTIDRIVSNGHQENADSYTVMLCALLESFTGTHPEFRAWKGSDPMVWLVEQHLVRRHGRAALFHTSASQPRPFWIHHELSIEITTSLPKLVKCFKKYQKPLEQFFLWRPENSRAVTVPARPRNGRRVDRGTFLSLMRHCNVHPQLFDRRELEQAIGFASGSSSPHPDGLNLPQFIEALVWCALKLQWIDETSTRTSRKYPEIVVVVKFLMLIFAMEGRGSMLTKRSHDLDVLVHFLQQHKEANLRSNKLRRFQGLLRAEPPHPQEVNHEKKPAAPVVHHTSIFRNLMAARDSADDPQTNKRAGSPQSFSIQDDLSGRRFHDDRSRQDRTPDARDRRLAPRSREDEREYEEREQPPQRKLPYRRSMSSGSTNHSMAHDFPVAHTQELTEHKPTQRDDAPQFETQLRQESRTKDREARISRESLVVAGHLRQDPRADTADNETDRNSGGVEDSGAADRVAVDCQASSFTGLHAPMDRESFLNEILSSITDVELLLQHSDERRSSAPAKSSFDPGTATDLLVSEPFSVAYPERHELLTSGRLPRDTLSPDSSSDAQQMLVDDIHVGDPMLDYLTFADRFSESQDWESQLTIADVAEHGIHAAFPSARNVLGGVHTGELDDLTYPHHATAYLRAGDSTV